MRLLLDTHVFLWLQTEPERLGSQLAVVEAPETELLLSVVSGWEIAIKYANGRLPLPEPPATYVPSRARHLACSVVPVEMPHVLAIVDLPKLHSDPFDRLLLSQALHLDLTIITADSQIVRYPVRTVQI